MSKLTERTEISLPMGYTTSDGREVVTVDFGDLSFTPDSRVKFMCASGVRGVSIPRASVQYRIVGYEGYYGARLDMAFTPTFWDQTEPEELERASFFEAVAPEIAKIIRSRL